MSNWKSKPVVKGASAEYIETFVEQQNKINRQTSAAIHALDRALASLQPESVADRVSDTEVELLHDELDHANARIENLIEQRASLRTALSVAIREGGGYHS